MATKKKAAAKAVKKVSPAKKAAPAKKTASKPAPAKSAAAKGKTVAVNKAVSKVASKHVPVKKNDKPAPKNAVQAKAPVKSTPVKTNKKETVKKEPVKKAEVKKAEVKKPESKEVKKAEVKKAAPVVPPAPSKPEKAAKPAETKKPEPVVAAAPPPPPPPPVKKPAAAPKPAKLVMPEIKTKSVKKYEPEFTKSVLDQPVNVQTGPTMRYSDSELTEFRELIQKKLDQAKKELAYLQGLITRKDEMGGDETENRYMTMEDGSMSMEREQLAQMASRQINYIDHLEKAMLRIENRTYGICRVTGKLIDKARLRAVPHATLSIEAKQMMNK
ncbi:MAG TPA: TraR/DksA C4-type zinc finger protein [Flavitalea sp.]|nr:TraR/DksA C4-type zinc finger protein [Flavitalea sp.]